MTAPLRDGGMKAFDDYCAAALRDVETWRERRDAIVRAAVTSLAGAGSVDFLSVQQALAAAFHEAARQEAEQTGSAMAWACLSRTAARLTAP